MGKGRRKAVHLLVSAQSISSDGGLAKNVLIGVVFILIFRLVRLATEVIASNSSNDGGWGALFPSGTEQSERQ